ncbi:MAG: homoserine dehydrogenase [Chloroflexota bacterium]|nr:homoserine dehydrogenase [Chloroflexota bacterium]
MERIPVLQVGMGGVGRTLVEQVLTFNERFGGRYGFRFAYVGLADRQGAIVADERIPPAVLLEALAAKRAGSSLADVPAGGPLLDWRNLLTPVPCIIVDVTAQDDAELGLAEAVVQGHRVVLANKKPLCGSMETFRALTERGNTRYEATVGAGLPVISTLRSLLDTGDPVTRISGCFSGTLGFLMTQLEDGQPFSAAVLEAKQRGWTEPDPRDDLSGMDVARKALILARTSGFSAEMEDVAVEPLFPDQLGALSTEQFLAELPTLDHEYRDRFDTIAGQGTTLRYAAQVALDRLSVALTEVPRDSPIGSLRGPDNLVVFQTQRYAERPLSVRGPGAGVEVTAAGVLSDMIALGREWR